MHFIISLCFYAVLYLFAYMMKYLTTPLMDVAAFIVFLILYRVVLNFTHKVPYISDAVAAITFTFIQNNNYDDTALYCFFFLMYFVCFESFTYTYLNRRKFDNTLTKS